MLSPLFVRKRCGHLQDCRSKAGFDGADGDVEQDRDLLPGEAASIRQMHDFPEVGGKTGDNSRKPIGIHGVQRLSRTGGLKRCNPLAIPGSFADVVNSAAPGDHKNPCWCNAERRIKRRGATPKVQEHILEHVLSFLSVTHKLQGKAEHTRRVAIVQHGKGDRVALCHLPQKVFVAGVHSV